MAEEKNYRDGLIDGRLSAIESIQHEHKEQLKNHNHRLTSLEKAVWIFLGAVALVQFWPAFEGLFK